MKNNIQTVSHPFPPVFDRHSKILILGTMPSPKSRENDFYYTHPSNRFWPVLNRVIGGKNIPADKAGRIAWLLDHKIALWDVLQSCSIINASDASIRGAVPNDIQQIFSSADIRAVFTTGQTACTYYSRFFAAAHAAVPLHCLPSSSAANAAYSLDLLVEKYKIILPYLA